jgi:hypothetical protein
VAPLAVLEVPSQQQDRPDHRSRIFAVFRVLLEVLMPFNF